MATLPERAMASPREEGESSAPEGDILPGYAPDRGENEDSSGVVKRSTVIDIPDQDSSAPDQGPESGDDGPEEMPSGEEPGMAEAWVTFLAL